MSKEKLKFCPFCSDKRINDVIKVIEVIMKYVDSSEFLHKFFSGDWIDQPLEVKQLIKKLKLKNNK